MAHNRQCLEALDDIHADNLAADLPNGSGVTPEERQAFEDEVARRVAGALFDGDCYCHEGV
jgi:hypothetical protein